MNGIYIATLKHGAASPFSPRSDVGVGATDEEKQKKSQDDSKKEKEKEGKNDKKEPGKPVEIDIDGLMARAVPLPIPAANIATLDVREEKVFYLTMPNQMYEGLQPGEKPILHVYDLKERKDANVVEGLSSYALSADGKKVLYKLDKDYIIADAAPGGANKGKEPGGTKKLDLSHMRVLIEPTQ
jgi:tricorn protease